MNNPVGSIQLPETLRTRSEVLHGKCLKAVLLHVPLP